MLASLLFHPPIVFIQQDLPKKANCISDPLCCRVTVSPAARLLCCCLLCCFPYIQSYTVRRGEMSKRYEGMKKRTPPEPNNRLGSALRCSVCQKDSQSPPGISIQMGLLYCMITYCARVHVCAVCIHSSVVTSCLIHTSCIIEVSEWIFSTLMEAVGPRGSAVTRKPGKAAMT